MQSLASVLLLGATSILPTADARMGRPASPGSVAGVHRRHRRRRRRRTVALVVGLTLVTRPAGCQARIRDGVEYQYCNGVWYAPQYQGTEVVYVVNAIDDGANTTIEVEE